MAMSRADIERFIQELRADPELRDRVRDAILADDFLALPGLVRQLGERVDQLTERLDQLTARIDQLTARVDQLTEDVQALTAEVHQLTQRMGAVEGRVGAVEGRLGGVEGRLGNLEGEMFEVKVQLKPGARLGVRYRNIRQVIIANEGRLSDAFDEGRIAGADWSDLNLIDYAALARRRGDPPDSEILVLVEISKTVDLRDVVRAHSRAAIATNAGVLAEAAVSGQAITAEAAALAEELGVAVIIDREEEAA